MASFVLETGTTPFAQTSPAATHSAATAPNPARSDASGATASKTRGGGAASAAAAISCVDDDGGANSAANDGSGAAYAAVRRRSGTVEGRNAAGWTRYVMIRCYQVVGL